MKLCHRCKANVIVKHRLCGTCLVTCSVCGKGPRVRTRKKLLAYCTDCKNEIARRSSYRTHRKNPIIRMLKAARRRAKLSGLAYNIDSSDVVFPKHCPILGLELEVSDSYLKNNSPSLDRIIPRLGYVKGNVRVISHRANTIKSDATIAELEAVIGYIKSSKAFYEK